MACGPWSNVMVFTTVGDQTVDCSGYGSFADPGALQCLYAQAFQGGPSQGVASSSEVVVGYGMAAVAFVPSPGQAVPVGAGASLFIPQGGFTSQAVRNLTSGIAGVLAQAQLYANPDMLAVMEQNGALLNQMIQANLAT